MNRMSVCMTGAALCVGLPATGQSAAWDYEPDFEAVTVIAPDHETGPGTDSETFLYELTFDNRFEKVLENGLQIGGRVTLRAQKDNPARPSFLGDFGGAPGPRGAYSGLSGTDPVLDAGTRAQIETAYIEFDGGYGELRFGRDRGIAARFHEGAPNALTHAGINDPYLDPDGMGILRTGHELTGPSAKASYATPRILGLRAGISYTPDSEARGLDRTVDAGGLQPSLNDAVEVAANLSRRLRSPDLRVEASVAWSTAEVGFGLPLARDRVQTVSAGANVEVSGVTIGGSWLTSDNGFDSADYDAWEAGFGFDVSDVEVSLNYGEAEDRLANLSSEAFSIAGSRDIANGLKLALAYQDQALRTGAGERSGRGLVVEITLNADFFGITGN